MMLLVDSFVLMIAGIPADMSSYQFWRFTLSHVFSTYLTREMQDVSCSRFPKEELWWPQSVRTWNLQKRFDDYPKNDEFFILSFGLIPSTISDFVWRFLFSREFAALSLFGESCWPPKSEINPFLSHLLHRPWAGALPQYSSLVAQICASAVTTWSWETDCFSLVVTHCPIGWNQRSAWVRFLLRW